MLAQNKCICLDEWIDNLLHSCKIHKVVITYLTADLNAAFCTPSDETTQPYVFSSVTWMTLDTFGVL